MRWTLQLPPPTRARVFYWNAFSTAAADGLRLINRLGATEASDELDRLVQQYQTLANACRELGDVDGDAINRGKFAGYHAALTD